MIAQLDLIPQEQTLPRGWVRLNENRAMDPHGYHWIIDGGLLLYVPGFRRSAYLLPSQDDDLAVVLRADLMIAVPISPAGIIKLPDGRKIGPRQWDH